MSDKLVAADAALKAGRTAEAIDLLIAAVDEDPARTNQVYRVLCLQLHQAGRIRDLETYARLGVGRHARDPQLWNLLGVARRQLRDYPGALEAFDAALRLMPGSIPLLGNKLNIFLDMGDGARAEALGLQLTRKSPKDGELQRMLGRAYRSQGKLDAAIARFRQAVALQPDRIDGWLDLSGTLGVAHRPDEALAVLDKALAALPEERHPKLIASKAATLRLNGQPRVAEALLRSYLPKYGQQAWLHHDLGALLTDTDRLQGNQHLRRAVELDPANASYLLTLVESLDRTRIGDEGAHIEEAYRLLKALLERKPDLAPGDTKIVFEVLGRVCDFEELRKLGTLGEIGLSWAESGRHTSLLKLMAFVDTLQDRYDLLEAHRTWARKVEAVAAGQPVRRPPPRPAGGKIRLGLMSSDLRLHPVGYFAQPLFDHLDDRFELYCYSFYVKDRVDRMQEYFASKATAFRWRPEISDRDAAQLIADDQVDFLIELGGSTYMNKLETMAWKPAPKQASWLGYPHSAGLSTIDYLICDPHNVPPRRDLLIETPLIMPNTWIALGRHVFSDEHPITPGLPEERLGAITFGTANNPHKYNPAMFAVWCEVLRATPGSRFMFVRPEGGTEAFRRNVLAQFAAGGIAAERIVFQAVRGQHMPVYNEIDITLDCFPLTGGTTTTESLWMGVPVVSLIGEAFYERLSASILTNSGVGDLVAGDRARFVELAVQLAADPARRRQLRTGLRDQMRAGPLGQTEQFARDFYELIYRTVTAA